MAALQTLPYDIHFHIHTQLDRLEDIVSLSHTCRALREPLHKNPGAVRPPIFRNAAALLPVALRLHHKLPLASFNELVEGQHVSFAEYLALRRDYGLVRAHEPAAPDGAAAEEDVDDLRVRYNYALILRGGAGLLDYDEAAEVYGSALPWEAGTGAAPGARASVVPAFLRVFWPRWGAEHGADLSEDWVFGGKGRVLGLWGCRLHDASDWMPAREDFGPFPAAWSRFRTPALPPYRYALVCRDPWMEGAWPDQERRRRRRRRGGRGMILVEGSVGWKLRVREALTRVWEEVKAARLLASPYVLYQMRICDAIVKYDVGRYDRLKRRELEKEAEKWVGANWESYSRDIPLWHWHTHVP